jgi:hypothetical protein
MPEDDEMDETNAVIAIALLFDVLEVVIDIDELWLPYKLGKSTMKSTRTLFKQLFNS